MYGNAMDFFVQLPCVTISFLLPGNHNMTKSN